MRFEGQHAPGRADQPRRDRREVAEVRPDVDEDVSRLQRRDHRVDAGLLVRSAVEGTDERPVASVTST